MALLTILYAKLILPKKEGHVEAEKDLFVTVEELGLNYGEKFLERRQRNAMVVMKSLLKTLKKFFYVTLTNDIVRPGPALYTLHGDLVSSVYQSVLVGMTMGYPGAMAESVDKPTEENDDRKDRVHREEVITVND
ncbi:hypothetical protein GJ688_16465 [Heliobacillus mobilis]|uniref:Uncharacterized protein n=1 Tax=Heliobacterium mobile TaxID=28064 RepID=A0A6I3SND6_HELMO|nr:hypothetical protein [Heliobacterium mobile]MTV50540.1 hypothetical protein [Heliobacterium mobile]